MPGHVHKDKEGVSKCTCDFCIPSAQYMQKGWVIYGKLISEVCGD